MRSFCQSELYCILEAFAVCNKCRSAVRRLLCDACCVPSRDVASCQTPECGLPVPADMVRANQGPGAV